MIFSSLCFLISQTFITIGEVDNATIGKAMLHDVMLHNFVVTMGVYANVWVVRETEVHDTTEYAMNIGITGYTVDYMIRPHVIKPIAFINVGICRFWGW